MKPHTHLDLKTLLLVAWSVAMSVTAQVVLRHGMGALSELSGVDLLLSAARTSWVLLGLGLYVLGTVSWLLVLSRIDLAVAYPLGSMNFVLVTLLAALVLGEGVSLLRWAGTLVILSGILVVARGERRPSAEDSA